MSASKDSKNWVPAIVFGILFLLAMWFFFFAPKTRPPAKPIKPAVLGTTLMSDLDDAFSASPMDIDVINKTYQLGLSLYHADYYESSFGILEHLVVNGHADSQMLLADHYRRGAGVDVDYARTAELYQAAADQGRPNAAYAMGNLLLQGAEGFPADRDRALVFYRQAAEQGYLPAQEKLDELAG